MVSVDGAARQRDEVGAVRDAVLRREAQPRHAVRRHGRREEVHQAAGRIRAGDAAGVAEVEADVVAVVDGNGDWVISGVVGGAAVVRLGVITLEEAEGAGWAGVKVPGGGGVVGVADLAVREAGVVRLLGGRVGLAFVDGEVHQVGHFFSVEDAVAAEVVRL